MKVKKRLRESTNDPIEIVTELVSKGIFTEEELSLVEFIPDDSIAIQALDNYIYYRTGYHLDNYEDLFLWG